MAAYLFGKLMVTDPSWLPEYTEHVTKQLADVGAKYLVKSVKTDVLESKDPAPTATIVIEFPSMEIAKEWYNSPEYQRLIKLRQTGSTIDLFLADGV